MPELPEVECLTRAVRGVLKGGQLLAARFLRKDLRSPIPSAAFRRVLVGQCIEDVVRRSKYMLVRTPRGFGIFHLGMTGNIFVETSATPARLHTHAVFHIAGADGRELWLHFVDPRRFGRIDALEGGAGELARHPSFAGLGPEPLEATAAELGRYLYETSRGRAAPIKNFLMDQRVVVGVGNIYASESLFRAGIHPGRKAGAIPHRRYDLLARYIRETLEKAIAAGGTSFSDYRHPDGDTGYFQVELNVYDRAGEPCRVCGTTVRQLRQAGRSTFYCGCCQK